MLAERLGGNDLESLFENGYRNLKKNIDSINDLNVFPVPDGDTGTNMVKTFGGGLKAARGNSDNVGEFMEKFASSVLFSARGNSGVILSQFVHGFARGLKEKESIIFSDLLEAFRCATEDAYKSILTPTEGTILTVIREAYEFLNEKSHLYVGFNDGIPALLEQMKKTLAKTPEMLPVLKEAGVVDSGGAGLVCIFEGMDSCLKGVDIEDIPDINDSFAGSEIISSSFNADSILEYGYCTEFILQLMNYKTDISAFNLDDFIKPLEELGDSIVAVCNDSVVKIHIHTFTPEKVLELARKYGEFVTIKIENMSVQHSEIDNKKETGEHLKYAIVTVASGSGIIDYFYNIGANVVIDGGQTNNPSVEAFMDAFENLDAEYIIVLPNNSNIFLTASQAAELYNGADIRVIPTRSVVEGYSALSMMNLWVESIDELIDDMTQGLNNVVTGYVTTATRDAKMKDVQIIKGDYIGLDNKNILSCKKEKTVCAKDIIDIIIAREEKEVITLFYGKDVTQEEVDTLKTSLENEYPLCEIGFVKGNQDVYSFIISLE